MPIRDIVAMNRSLDNDYGTTRGPNAPAGHLLALFVSDPMLSVENGGNIECSAASHPGYARVSVAPENWLPAANGRKDLAAPKQFPATTGEWDPEPEYWALYDSAGAVMWDCGPLSDPLQVTGAGSGPLVSVSVFYDDALAEPDED